MQGFSDGLRTVTETCTGGGSASDITSLKSAVPFNGSDDRICGSGKKYTVCNIKRSPHQVISDTAYVQGLLSLGANCIQSAKYVMRCDPLLERGTSEAHTAAPSNCILVRPWRYFSRAAYHVKRPIVNKASRLRKSFTPMGHFRGLEYQGRKSRCLGAPVGALGMNVLIQL